MRQWIPSFIQPVQHRFLPPFCSNLIKKMLASRASARPDLGVVLTYPIVKKALRAYLQDIFGRTDEKMGKGTMLIRDGAMAVARDAGSIHRASAPEVHRMHMLYCSVVVCCVLILAGHG